MISGCSVFVRTNMHTNKQTNRNIDTTKTIHCSCRI